MIHLHYYSKIRSIVYVAAMLCVVIGLFMGMCTQDNSKASTERYVIDPISAEEWIIGCFMNSVNSKADQRIPKAIVDIAPKYGLDPLFVAAIVYKESTFKIKCPGAAGERGLMQIHPCHRKRVEWSRMYEIEPNIHAGCAEFARHLVSSKGSYAGATRRYTGGVSARYDKTYRKLQQMVADYVSGKHYNAK